MNAVEIDRLWGEGYSGAGVKLGMVDTGVTGHPNLQLAGYSYWGNDPTTSDQCDHGTYVAGIIRSNHAIYRGAAYGSSIYSAKAANTDCIADTPAVNAALVWLDSKGAKIVSNTLGSNVDSNGNDGIEKYFDWWVVTRSVFLAVAAGNTPVGGSHYVDIPGGAYNIVTVGNVDDKNTVSRTNDWIYSTSAWGVANSTRAKPDVVAPGTLIKSTNNQLGFSDVRPDGLRITGTSFAVPHVVGLAGLLRHLDSGADYLELKGRVLTGDYFLRDTWSSVWAWSYIDGYWARQSSYAASGSVGHQQWWETNVYLHAGYYNTFTLVWNREMSAYNQVRGFSDLDLVLQCPGGVSDSSTSAVNNVEKVSMTRPTGTTCKLRVYGFLPSGITSQSFRIVGLSI